VLLELLFFCKLGLLLSDEVPAAGIQGKSRLRQGLGRGGRFKPYKRSSSSSSTLLSTACS